MPKRGRPPHPDILTPREREVLELLRLDLTNEQIADRLEISLDGAKYHVSEILSKLGVSSREEAAVWQPPVEKALWRRAVALPLVAKGAGLAFTAAAIAGLVLLAIGVAKTGPPDSTDEVAILDLDAIMPGDDPARDLTLLNARSGGEIARVDIRRASGDAASELGQEGLMLTTPLADTDADAWLITVYAWFESGPGISVPFGAPAPQSGCWKTTTWTRESQSTDPLSLPQGGQTYERTDDFECEYDAVSRQAALIIVGRQEYRSSDGETSPPLVASSTLGAVSSALAEAGFPVETATNASDSSVWLVMYTAPLLLGEGSIPEGGTPRPTTLLICSQVATVVDAATGEVLLNTIQPASTCG